MLSVIEENWTKLNGSILRNVYVKKRKWILSVEFLKRSGHMNEYFCVCMNGRALCLICSELIAVLKEYDVTRH